MAIAYLGYKVDSSQVAKAETRLDKMSGAAGVAAKAAGALTVAFGAMFAGGAVIREISNFETSMSRVGAISRATASDLADMRDIAKDLGSSTEFSASHAADGLGFLAMAGFDAKEAIAAIPAVLDLATASGMQLASAADIASNVMSGFGLEAAQAADVADVLAAASSRANTDVSQLGRAMSTVAPISAALGIGLEDTAAAIGVMSDAGIQGERAGTALRGVLASLAGPTDQARDALAQYGITLDQVNPETNSLADIMALLADRGISTADAMTIFGREAASGALVMVEANDRLREFGDELGRVDGAAADMAGTMRDNLGGDIDGLKSAVSGLIIAMGDAGLTAVLRGVVHIITGVTRAVSSAVSAFGKLTGAVASLFPAQSQLGTAVDNTVLAMGDEIAQANKLFALLGTGTIISQSAALAKLSEAEAYLRDADAKRENANATIALQRAQATLLYDRQLEMLNSIRSGTEAYEEMERSVVATLDRIGMMTNEIDGSNAAFTAARTEVERIRVAIENSKDGMVTFNGEAITANEIGTRLSGTIEGISFGNAIGGAELLAERLGVSLTLAAQIAAMAGTANVGDEVFDPRSPRYNQAAQDAANIEARLAEIRSSFEGVARSSGLASSGVGSVGKAAEGATDDLKGADQSAASLASQMDGNLLSAIESVADAFSDFIARGFKDFKSFAASILDTFKRMISQMIVTAASNKIMLSMGIGGSAIGTAANAASGLTGIGGAVAGAGGIAGLGSAFMGGASFFASGVASGGIAGGVSAIGTALSGATMGIGGAAAALGAVALPLGALALVVGGLGKKVKKKTKELDSGLSGIIDGFDVSIRNFQTLQDKVTTSKFFGLSKSTETSIRNLYQSDPNSPIIGAVGEIQTAVANAANVFGYGASIFDQFSFNFKLSLKGLTEDQKIAKINEQLAIMGDGMAALVPNFEDMNSLISGANQAIAETYALGSTRFEAEMLAAARRRGEINVGREMQGVSTPNSLIRLNKVEENTQENNRLMDRLVNYIEGWQINGVPVEAT